MLPNVVKSNYEDTSQGNYNFSDPFQDLVSAMLDEEETEAESSTAKTENEETTLSTTTLVPIPKSCPAPDVTYNGSLLSSGVEASFQDIHEVEFEVRTGPFPGDNQRCKLTCVKGQWVGPLCRTKESKKKIKRSFLGL